MLPAVHVSSSQAELKNVERFILRGTNEEDVQVVRDIVCNMPSTDVATATLRTYKEIKHSYERLSKINMRRSELVVEVNRLGEQKHQNERAIMHLRNRIHSLERKRTGMSVFAAVATGTLIGLPLGIVGFSKMSSYDKSISIMATEVRASETRVASLTKEIAAKEAEISSGSVDQTELQSVQVELEQLEALKD